MFFFRDPTRQGEHGSGKWGLKGGFMFTPISARGFSSQVTSSFGFIAVAFNILREHVLFLVMHSYSVSLLLDEPHVACGVSHSYSAHLYEVLGVELGDCERHTGGGDDK